jgi:hypothetical protein
LTCHPGENVRATGEFVVNLPSFEREILEMVRIVDMFAASQETMRVGMPYEA